MHLFLIAAVPLSFVYVLILRDEAGEPSNLVGVSAVRGMLAYLVELLVFLVLRRFAPPAHTGIAAYFSSAGYDFVLPILGTVLLFLWFTPNLRSHSGSERRLCLLSFMTGALTLAGIMDIFVRSSYFGVYELFLLPGLRVVAILLIPLLYRLFVEETFWIRGLYVAGIVALPLSFGAVYLLVVLGFPLPALLIVVAFFTGSWLVTVFGSRTVRGARG